MFALELNETVTAAALALAGVVGAVVLLFLLFGLFGARSLVRREFAAYFLSPVAYVVLVVFLAVLGYRFYLTLERLTASGPSGTEFPMRFMFDLLPSEGESFTLSRGRQAEMLSGVAFWFVYLLIPPLLTMRLFAEERSSGTLEVLMTAPLREWQVVLSKYVACFGFYLFLWLPTLAYLPVLLGLGVAERPSRDMDAVQPALGRRVGRGGCWRCCRRCSGWAPLFRAGRAAAVPRRGRLCRRRRLDALPHRAGRTSSR